MRPGWKDDPNLAVLVGDLFGPGLREASQKPVSEVMSPIRVKVEGDDPIAKALFLIIQEKVGLMQVIQDSKVAGMIRLSDLFTKITHLVLATEPLPGPCGRLQLRRRGRRRRGPGPVTSSSARPPTPIAYTSKQFTAGEFFLYG